MVVGLVKWNLQEFGVDLLEELTDRAVHRRVSHHLRQRLQQVFDYSNHKLEEALGLICESIGHQRLEDVALDEKLHRLRQGARCRYV